MRSEKSSLHDRLSGKPGHHFLEAVKKHERKAARPAPPEKKNGGEVEANKRRLGNSRAPRKDLFRFSFLPERKKKRN
jgi:hypothetical protein